MPTDPTLTDKEKELVAIAASVAAGCQPCTAFHFEAARKAGAAEAEIARAVDDALHIRRSSTTVIAAVAERLTAGGSSADLPDCSENTLLDELISVGAALAVNCVTSMENHMAAAKRLGASDRQMRTVLGIARMVKKVAEQKAEATAASVIESEGTARAEASDGKVDCCAQEPDCSRISRD